MIRARPEASDRNRTEYFDVLRSVAIIAVVMLHTAAARWYSVEPASVQWQTLNVYDSIVRFCVPIFFMISGALFLDPGRDVTLRSILRRSLPRLLVAYVVWSGVYALFSTFFLTGYSGPVALIDTWITGHYHLWFLLVLMGLYLVTPLLRKISESDELATYFVVLAVVFAVLLPVFTEVPYLGESLNSVLNTAQIQLVLGYSVYFVLGHLLHSGLFARVPSRWLVVIAVVATLTTMGVTSLLSLRGGVADATYYAYLTPNVLVMSVAVFLLAQRWGERRRLSPKAASTVAFIGGCSFGVYLVHPLIQEALGFLGVDTDLLPAVVSVPVVSLAILVPSVALAWVLRRIPVVGRYIA